LIRLPWTSAYDNIALDDIAVTELELRSTVKGFDLSRIVDVAAEFAEAGVTHFIYALNSHEPEMFESTVDALARDLRPQFQSR